MVANYKKLTLRVGRRNPEVVEEVTILHTENTPHLLVINESIEPMLIPLSKISRVVVNQDNNSLEVIMKK